MENLLTYKKVAAQLDLSERFLIKLVKSGKIPFVKIGKAVRFVPSKIEEWVVNKSNADFRFVPPGTVVSMRKKLTIVKVEKV